MTRKQFKSEIKAIISILLLVALIVAVMLNGCTSPKQYVYKDVYKYLHTADSAEQKEINKMLNRSIK